MYVVGTAGHVDHGKSTLVHALTGIDPDRLKEEKERGMTIDLGFAWLPLPSGNEVSIIDVPGHERFVNNMLAGVGGIDLALLIVAADESVMPQTREHLAILDLLQIRRGLIVLTKKDLVDEEWLELVEAEVEDVLKGTVLESAEIMSVSAMTGEGVPELVAKLDEMLQNTVPKRDVGRPRLPIDRAFTITGFGTVVTGTLMDGRMDVGQEVELVLSGTEARIRGLQTHRNKQDQALPGTRVAANLTGLQPDEIIRGDVLTTRGWLKPTTAMDVRLRVIPDAPQSIRHNMFLTVHTGSNEVIARVRLLEKDVADPGDVTWAQLKLESPLAVVKGDYYVVRSNQTTLGGGNIVDTHARRPRRRNQDYLDRLTVMEKGSERDILLKTIEMSEPGEFRDIVNRANLEPEVATQELEAMATENLVRIIGQRKVGPGVHIYSASGWIAVSNRATRFLSTYHGQYPLRKGASREELRSRLGMTAPIFNQVLPKLQDDGLVIEEGSLVRTAEHRRGLTEDQENIVSRYIRLLDSDPYSPPTDSPIDQEILALIAEEGRVVKVSETVVFSASAYNDMVDKISAHIQKQGDVSVADVRDMLDTSRKYALALMDYLDQQRITRRVGDVRVLR